MTQIDDLVRAREYGATGAARRVRVAARLSTVDVARAIGTTPATISRWERRLRVPHGDLAIRWARLLRRLERERE